MGLRFSDDGPEFPVELIDALLSGEVVFLCGAGVSAPQLPGFGGLVEKVYSKIGAKKTPAEADAIKSGRFEEALGALSRRLSNRAEMHDTVRNELVVDAPILDNHSTLLRLSRGLDNGVVLITTNFDTFFERALDEMNGPGSGKVESLAGQALPAPGSTDFHGIIHLHGRLADQVVGVSDTPLVLTSAEYGEAYMRSGWASRFLFDLVRCRSLVLIGYSAGDAPVRYFLNVLEADRERFRDLKTVYALDAVEKDAAQALERWDALAVSPLAYRKGRSTASERHAVLWRDLAKLADLTDTPKAWRRARAAEILAQPFDGRPPAELDAINWIFGGKRDVWDVAITVVTDPKWFDYFTSQKLLPEAEAGWVLGAWCGLGWTNQTRIDAGASWYARHGKGFREAVGHRLASSPPTEALYFRAWGLLARSSRERVDHDLQAYRVGARVRGAHCVDMDLRDGVRLLTPRLDIRERYGRSKDTSEGADPKRLGDLFYLRLTVDDRGGMPEIVGALLAVPAHSDRLLQLATEQLRNTIALAREADLISVGWDTLDNGVPTVEVHAQNEHHDGAVHLVQLMTALFPRVAATDPTAARLWAETWRGLPSRLGLRLWLHTLRHPNVYTSDEVAAALLLIPKESFWAVRRELILAMAERLSSASAERVELLCDRILAEGPTLYEDFELADPTTQDWRPQVRDRDIWLRLAALRRAGVLPVSGANELDEIAKRHSFIAGDFDEQDLFGSYSTGVRFVSGDANLLKEAETDNRLSVAHRLTSDWDPTAQQSWSAYCSVDPAGALEALRRGEFAEANIRLWNDLIGTLAWSPQQENEDLKAQRRALVRSVFDHLDGANDEFLSGVADRLADLWPVAKEARLATIEAWWDRLWSVLEQTTEPLDLSGTERFYDRVINRAAGRLAEHLVKTIGKRRGRAKRLPEEDKARLRRIFGSPTDAGWIGRGACVRYAAYLLSIDRADTLNLLRPWLGSDDVQGMTLRSVLVEFAQLGPPATRAFRKEVIQGVLESTSAEGTADHVASRLLRPLFGQAHSKGKVNWGLKPSEIRDVLTQVSPSILEGAAHCFRVWVSPTDMTPESAWKRSVRPVFEQVWPREARYKRAAHTHDLAWLCVAAGKAFPEAFSLLKHYLVPYDGDWIGLHFLGSSKAPELFPDTTLDLLWAICGPGCEGQSHELGEILDRLATAKPALVVDRRYQWLEQRAMRLG